MKSCEIHVIHKLKLNYAVAIKVAIPILLKAHSSRLQAVAWIFLAIFSLIRFQADYLLVVGVCLSLSVANIVGFTKCRKGTCLMWLDLIIHCVV